MQVYKSIETWRKARQQLSSGPLGFVPTMGALHAGHMKLVERSIQENKHTLVSIFINPTQFDNNADLQHYPKTLDADIKLLEEAGVHTLIMPNASEIYADDYRFILRENALSKQLCGQHRPGHFDGVLTVVLKLFNLVQPNKAYFGKKDFQQYLLIKDMAEALFLDIEIIGCETVRAKDGLALSSRNTKLSIAERQKASLLYERLRASKPIDDIAGALEKDGFKIDYVEEHADRRFAAVWLGDVRLIDNVEKHSV
ncbi:MAG: pantoate--beta-alanine ligase [Myxococcota bacterium]|jgi:pantoate--beta-alanine ligase|nr:pantoate--beta-alanine ligase [Myxococcota bacterium]